MTNADSNLFDLLEAIGQDIREIKADLASTGGYRAQQAPASAGEELFTLTEWADTSGNYMTKSQKHDLENIVSSTCKMMALELPPKVALLSTSGSWRGYLQVQVYPDRYFVLIGMCWAKLIASQTN